MNRSEFVIRLLEYYSDLGFSGQILIGDSSGRQEYDKTSEAARKFRPKLRVAHFHYPGLDVYAATAQLIQNAATPYSSFLPDDDFLVPGSMEEGMAFLERHSDYSCVWGKSIIFDLKNKGAYGPLENIGASNEPTVYSIEKDTAAERLLFHVKNYTSVFIGVCRTTMFKQALRSVLELSGLADPESIERKTVGRFGELVTSFSLVAQGKIRSLDRLHWVRQNHGQRYHFQDSFDWITSPNWLSCQEIVARQIARDIVEKEGVSPSEADRIWKQVFWSYLNDCFLRKYQNCYEPISGLPMIWRSIKSRLFRSLSSPYQDDFMPVYRIVTKPQGLEL